MIFESKIEELSKIHELIAQKAKAIGLEDKKTRQLQLAAEEAFVNIIQHGKKEDQKQEINVLVEEDELGLNVILKDRGKEFNPLRAKVVIDLDEPLHERVEGGLGLYFIRQFVDNLSYHYENGWNVLKLKKLK